MTQSRRSRNEYLRSAQDGSVSVRPVAPAKRAPRSDLPEPLVWTFDGPFERCLADLEDTLRRAIVMVGGVSRVALLIDLSLPALQRRVAAGDALQPGWGRFQERLAGYGLPWHTPEEENRMLGQQCLKQRVEPHDVAAMVAFLASDDARMCTGHEYFVDAGWR